jgi:hypothetical protein
VAQKYLVKANRTVGILNPIKPTRPTMERFTPHGQIR